MEKRMVELVYFHPSCIEVSDRGRVLNAESVAVLVESISKIGPRSPLQGLFMKKMRDQPSGLAVALWRQYDGLPSRSGLLDVRAGD
jgi:hypothetical protein